MPRVEACYGRPVSCNIAQVVRSWALREPDRSALVLTDRAMRELSYGALDLRARRVAARLADEGIRPGERLALIVPNGLGFVDAWFGGWYAGCTLLPVPPMSAPPELAQRLQHARCRALVADQDTRALGEEALKTCPGVALLDADELAEGEHAVDGPCELAPERIALLLYTSGTTGTAKGAMITHASLGLHTAALVHHVLRLTGEDRVLAALPLTHSYGIRMTLLAPFYAGARSVLLGRFQAARVLRLLAEAAITWFPGVPTMFHALAHEPDAPAGPARTSALRWCLSAGAPLSREARLRAEAKLGVPVRQGFGLTEATFSTIATPDDPGAEDTVGRAVFGVEVRIVEAREQNADDEAGRPLAPGELGEICVRGPNVMAGYLDDPDASAAALRDGWMRSGDLGQLDAAGRLTIVDRLKDLILRGGFNVYPAEVEAVLHAHPSVRDVLVVGVPDPRYGEEVLAALVLRPDATFDLAELDAFCRARLSRVKVPRLFALLDALPVGASGKLLRREIKRRALAGELAIARVDLNA